MNKILIVEDNDKNRKMIVDILRYHGYEIMEAVNGKEAIKKVKEERPDLIIMDMQMPVMNGFNAVRILKSDPETRDIKIMVTTSYAMAGDKEKVIAIGADDYMPKPINTRELPERVKRLIEMTREQGSGVRDQGADHD